MSEGHTSSFIYMRRRAGKDCAKILLLERGGKEGYEKA
jgi:hypothetical protein